MSRAEVVYSDPDVLDERGQRIEITRRDLLPSFLEPNQLVDEVAELYERGLPKGCSTGWRSVDEHYTVASGQWTLITGVPGHGKSEWLDALMVNLAKAGKWRFAVYSPENSPVEIHLSKLLEKYTGRPFGAGPTQRMSPEERGAGMAWLQEHFGFIRPNGEQPASIDQILSECYTWVQISPAAPAGVVIDPWNELEHQRPERWSETEYISDSLSRLRRFARNTKCHVWVVAHPTKLLRDKDGSRPVPTPYDVSGSAHWFNKADNCVTVWRDPRDDGAPVQIYVQKIRFKNIGKVGKIELNYDRVTGRYSVPRSGARDYRQAKDGE